MGPDDGFSNGGSGYGNPLAVGNKCSSIKMSTIAVGAKGSPYCAYDSGPDVGLTPDRELYNLTGNLSYQLNDNHQLFADLLYELIGTSVASQESVVVSFALAQQVAVGEMNAFEALCLAASLGGDTDTIAAILGAMLGACLGLQCWPDAMIEQVKAVNGLELQPLVQGLLKLR